MVVKIVWNVQNKKIFGVKDTPFFIKKNAKHIKQCFAFLTFLSKIIFLK